MRIISMLLLAFSAQTMAEQWIAYPAELPQFNYEDTALQENWTLLTQGPALEWPDADSFAVLLSKYPALIEQSKLAAYKPDAHPALKALATGNEQPFIDAYQQVWRLHYEGKFQDSYDLATSLGPIGMIPAVYTKVMYTTLLGTDKKQKLAAFREAAKQAEKNVELTPGYAFTEFGLLYARARILEILDTSSATGSGFLGSTQDGMRELAERFPQQGLYSASLGGIQAGVVERVGSMLGRMTYGATESRAIAAFEDAITLTPELTVLQYEYAIALSRLNAKKYQARIIDLLSRCNSLPIYSAEEALNQQKCANWLRQLQISQI